MGLTHTLSYLKISWHFSCLVLYGSWPALSVCPERPFIVHMPSARCCNLTVKMLL